MPGTKSAYIIIYILTLATLTRAQSVVSGVVINKNTGEAVEGGAVTSYIYHTGVFTDYKGRYSINTDTEDTVQVSILGYESQSIAIHGGWHTTHLVNVSLEVSLITLHDLTITQRILHKSDSLQNREENYFIFDYRSPHVITSFLHIPFVSTAYGGVQFGTGVGFSIENAYERWISPHFKRIKHYQKILVAKEKTDYVKHFFNPRTVSEITGLTGNALQKFLKSYTPDYSSLAGKSEYDIDILIKDSFAKNHQSNQ